MFRDLKPYLDVADSGTPWLGHVPAHWAVAGARSVFSEVGAAGHADEPLLSVTIGRGVLPQAELLAGSSKKDSSNVDRSKYKLVEPGDIAYNKMRAWQGAVGLSAYRGIVSPAYVVLRSRGVSGRYLHHLLRTPAFAKEAERRSYGITSDQWSLRPEHFKMIHFPMPPEGEQAAIVKYLGHAHARIDRAIAAKRKLIALLEEQKQAIINGAVTRGLDPAARMKDSGIPWIGRMPGHWELRRAKEVCARIVDCKNRTPRFVDGGAYQVVRTTCIRHGSFSLEGAYTTDGSDFALWTERGAPRVGDVFFTREAPTGEAALVPDRDDLCMGQRMMYFRPDPLLLDPQFLLHSIYGSVVRAYIDVSRNGSTVGHLRLGQVGALPILWCPLEEQRAIVDHIRRETAGLDLAGQTAAREMALLREFRARLTSDVVTGQVDVRAIAAALPDFVESVGVDADGDEDEPFDELGEVLEGEALEEVDA